MNSPSRKVIAVKTSNEQKRVFSAFLHERACVDSLSRKLIVLKLVTSRKGDYAPSFMQEMARIPVKKMNCCKNE